MKRCAKCGEYKELNDFNLRRVGDSRVGPYCKACQRAYNKAHYKRYKRKHNLRRHGGKVRQVKRNQTFIVGYLAEHPCVDCGESDPIVLEFDHVRGEKCESLCVMVANAHPISRISAELLKCEVRCANCHRRKTAREFRWYKLGA